MRYVFTKNGNRPISVEFRGCFPHAEAFHNICRKITIGSPNTIKNKQNKKTIIYDCINFVEDF